MWHSSDPRFETVGLAAEPLTCRQPIHVYQNGQGPELRTQRFRDAFNFFTKFDCFYLTKGFTYQFLDPLNFKQLSSTNCHQKPLTKERKPLDQSIIRC